MFAPLPDGWTGSTLSGLSDGTDTLLSGLDESVLAISGAWGRDASSDAGSDSALGFGFDRFRGPMKQGGGGGLTGNQNLLISGTLY